MREITHQRFVPCGLFLRKRIATVLPNLVAQVFCVLSRSTCRALRPSPDCAAPLSSVDAIVQDEGDRSLSSEADAEARNFFLVIRVVVDDTADLRRSQLLNCALCDIHSVDSRVRPMSECVRHRMSGSVSQCQQRIKTNLSKYAGELQKRPKCYVREFVREADSGSAYRGSNPWGAANSFQSVTAIAGRVRNSNAKSRHVTSRLTRTRSPITAATRYQSRTGISHRSSAGARRLH